MALHSEAIRIQDLKSNSDFTPQGRILYNRRVTGRGNACGRFVCIFPDLNGGVMARRKASNGATLGSEKTPWQAASELLEVPLWYLKFWGMRGNNE